MARSQTRLLTFEAPLLSINRFGDSFIIRVNSSFLIVGEMDVLGKLARWARRGSSSPGSKSPLQSAFSKCFFCRQRGTRLSASKPPGASLRLPPPNSEIVNANNKIEQFKVQIFGDSQGFLFTFPQKRLNSLNYLELCAFTVRSLPPNERVWEASQPRTDLFGRAADCGRSGKHIRSLCQQKIRIEQYDYTRRPTVSHCFEARDDRQARSPPTRSFKLLF